MLFSIFVFIFGCLLDRQASAARNRDILVTRGHCKLTDAPVVTLVYDPKSHGYRLRNDDDDDDDDDDKKQNDSSQANIKSSSDNKRILEQQQQQQQPLAFGSWFYDEQDNVNIMESIRIDPNHQHESAPIPMQEIWKSNHQRQLLTNEEEEEELRQQQQQLQPPVLVQVRRCPCVQEKQKRVASNDDHNSSSSSFSDFYCPIHKKYCYLSWGSVAPLCVTESQNTAVAELIWLPTMTAFCLVLFCVCCSFVGRNAFGFVVAQVLCGCTWVGKAYLRWSTKRLEQRFPGRSAMLIRANLLRRQRHLEQQQEWFQQLRQLLSRQQLPQADAANNNHNDTNEPVATNLPQQQPLPCSPQRVGLKTRCYHTVGNNSKKQQPSAAAKNGGGLMAKASFSSSSWDHNGDDIDDEIPFCAICFSELQEGDRVGVLVQCSHLFHVQCLKTWIVKRNVCPLCLNPAAAEWTGPLKRNNNKSLDSDTSSTTTKTTTAPDLDEAALNPTAALISQTTAVLPETTTLDLAESGARTTLAVTMEQQLDDNDDLEAAVTTNS